MYSYLVGVSPSLLRPKELTVQDLAQFGRLLDFGILTDAIAEHAGGRRQTSKVWILLLLLLLLLLLSL
jgi:hypothetical protein